MKRYADGHCIARHLSSLSIEVGKFIESTNYVAGAAGWHIDGAGNFEANDGTFRRTLAGANLLIESGSITIDATLPILNATDSLVIGSDGTLTLSAANEMLILAENDINLSNGTIVVNDDSIGFFDVSPKVRQSVTGSTTDGILQSLLGALEFYGLIIDATT